MNVLITKLQPLIKYPLVLLRYLHSIGTSLFEAGYLADKKALASGRSRQVLTVFVVSILMSWALLTVANILLLCFVDFSPRPKESSETYLVCPDGRFAVDENHDCNTDLDDVGPFAILCTQPIGSDDVGRRYFILARPESNAGILADWVVVGVVAILEQSDGVNGYSNRQLEVQTFFAKATSLSSRGNKVVLADALVSEALTEVQWHVLGNVTEEPSFARLEHRMYSLRVPRFPVTSNGICGWLRGNWKSVLSLNDADVSEVLSSQFGVYGLSLLERELESDWKHVSYGIPVVLMRILNGPDSVIDLCACSYRCNCESHSGKTLVRGYSLLHAGNIEAGR